MISAGGLFHFKKDQQAYSSMQEDYATEPLFAAATDNRFFLYVLEDFYTGQSLERLQFTSAEAEICQGDGRASLPSDSSDSKRSRDSSDPAARRRRRRVAWRR